MIVSDENVAVAASERVRVYGVRLREATSEDLPQVLALYAQPGLDDGDTLSLAEAEAIFATFSRYPSYRLFVASVDEKIVGTYALAILHNLAHRGAKSALVEDVVVDAAYQGEGIGRAMMNHAMRLAHDADCYKLALSSNKKREAAHSFYESLGFEKHGYSFIVRGPDE
jgi:GNAT superfamily N-acetyltransferase